MFMTPPALHSTQNLKFVCVHVCVYVRASMRALAHQGLKPETVPEYIIYCRHPHPALMRVHTHTQSKSHKRT